jgi:hypothetical protein
MKKVKYLIVAAFLVIAAACSKDYVAPNSFSDAGWYTSGFRAVNLGVGINDFMSFSDVSQGLVSHSWTIQEGDQFLKGPITSRDTILEPFIIPGNAVESTDKTVHVYFTTPGTHKLTLKNVYAKPVTFFGLDTIKAVQEGSQWVISKDFMVEVYEKLVPALEIRQNGILIPQSLDTIYVKTGGSLNFLDVTTIGKPDTRNLSIAGKNYNTVDTKVTFDKEGVFFAFFTVSRTLPEIPAASKSIRITNPIKVKN